MHTKITTLILIQDDARILLGIKKRGFGAGRWNGFGGKVHEGETIEDAARRELHEEAGVTVGVLTKIGVVQFRCFKPTWSNELHIFTASEYFGEPQETEEMRPQWFPLDAVPYDDMWQGDRMWMPLALAGKIFRGEYLYDEQDQILSHSLVELDQIS